MPHSSKHGEAGWNGDRSHLVGRKVVGGGIPIGERRFRNEGMMRRKKTANTVGINKIYSIKKSRKLLTDIQLSITFRVQQYALSFIVSFSISIP